MPLRPAATFLLAAAAAALAAPALAQQPPISIPFDLVDGNPRGDDNSLTFCIDDRGPGSEPDEAIATAIAEALFLEPRFFRISEMPGRIDTFQGVTDDLLFVLLEDECDAYIGAQLGVRIVLAEWATVTAPYMDTRYVLASTDPAIDSFAALRAADVTVGLPIASRMNIAVSVFQGDTRRRVFDDETELFEALMDGRVRAGMFWAPALLDLTGWDPAAAGLTLSRVDPVPDAETPVAMEMRTDLDFLRATIDQAIAALRADGTIDAILAEYGFGQIP